jgi:outer membrane protein OmpA-like peptidoglycan-associated protein
MELWSLTAVACNLCYYFPIHKRKSPFAEGEPGSKPQFSEVLFPDERFEETIVMNRPARWGQSVLWLILILASSWKAHAQQQSTTKSSGGSAKDASPTGHPKYNLNGLWTASYPGGPLRVEVRQTSSEIEATLVDGNSFVPAGKVTVKAALSGFPNPLPAEQICAYSGYSNAYWIKVVLKIEDSDHLVEDAVPGSSCGGFPVTWKRADQQFIVKEEKGHIGITVDEAVLFDTGKYKLKPQAEAVLAQIKSTVLDQRPASKVRVEGHTDNVGGSAYNQRLSTERADVVAAWLKAHGSDPARIEAKGYGKLRPKYPNTTAANRARNRRVEIFVE